jgi:hypothetical protein
MENVPPLTSSGLSLRLRVREARSLIARAMPVRLRLSAFLITGTIKPFSVSTAIPRFIKCFTIILSSSIDAFTSGNSFRVLETLSGFLRLLQKETA